jgi:hypothetical protein
MAALMAEPQATPAPVSFDHAIVRAVDVGAAFEFTSGVMGGTVAEVGLVGEVLCQDWAYYHLRVSAKHAVPRQASARAR